uniref:C-type lectin domain-containing protein n=1 Tax=Amphilophus citrinellus TaxID=61819 RepID=A0A3Q0S3H1_AMPCI
MRESKFRTDFLTSVSEYFSLSVSLSDPLFSDVSKNHTLVQTSLTWSEAQSHCRSHYTDLSTITSLQDNSETTSVLPQTWDAWIGLYGQYWMWSDWSKASSLPWAGGQPDDIGKCVTMDTSGRLHNHNCNDKRAFLCYKGESFLTVFHREEEEEEAPPGNRDCGTV